MSAHIEGKPDASAPTPQVRPGLLVRTLLSIGTRTSWIASTIAAAALLVVMTIVSANIVGRYVFASPFSWAEEASLFFMIFGIFIGAVSVTWEQAHLRIDAFVNLFSQRWRAVIDVVSAIATVVILVPIVVAGYGVINQLFEFEQRSDALHLPIWIPQSVIPLSLLLVICMAVLRLIVRYTLDPTDAGHGPHRH